MNREIKFRAWLRGELIYSDKLYAVCVNQTDRLYHFFKYIRFDSPLMQSTGLKDKNGVEIYEGDVIKGLMTYPKATDGVLPTMGVVEYCEGFAAFSLKNDAGQTLFHNHHVYSFEVIGNIYENPDLLSPTI